jgi:hypothetical protein
MGVVFPRGARSGQTMKRPFARPVSGGGFAKFNLHKLDSMSNNSCAQDGMILDDDE